MKRLPHAAIVPLFALALVPTAVVWQSAGPVPDRPATSSAAAPGAVASAPTPSSSSATVAPMIRPQQARTPVPTRVQVPSLGIDSSLEHLHTAADGELKAPRAWQRAGWFAEGTRPGATGPAVIAGHVDSPDGPAVFARLSEVTPGDLVIVQRRDGTTARFRVDRTRLVPKDGFPTAAVYGPTPDAQLRLITCDGPYVATSGGYQDNLVVFASEVGA